MSTITTDQVKDILAQKLEQLDGVLAPKADPAGVRPFLYTKETGIDGLALWPWYRWPEIAARLQDLDKGAKLGVLVRGCDERALIEMHKRKQVDINELTLIGIPCYESDGYDCFCDKPYPREIALGEKTEGAKWPELDEFRQMPKDEKLAWWRAQFDRCIKCYGCRNTCPVCFCQQCVLEEDVWVDKGVLPPPMATFHLIRAMHMAERCIACRECEATCPSDIKLTTLYRLLKQDVKEMFGYETGADPDELPPINMKGGVEGD